MSKLEISEDLLEQSVMYLIHHEPFFAALLQGMTRNYTTRIPTVGVNVTDNVNIFVNPYFWKSLTVLEQVDVLKHECVFGGTLVSTNRGLISIKKIVDKKLKVKALSISSKGKKEYKEIIEYSKKFMKNYPNKKWVSVKYTTNQNLYKTLMLRWSASNFFNSLLSSRSFMQIFKG